MNTKQLILERIDEKRFKIIEKATGIQNKIGRKCIINKERKLIFKKLLLQVKLSLKIDIT